ncbi:MAG: hypothetical protein HZB43_10335 [candidate division Zixibacteria bacterium]|nr:hypothetical protein [candidate division Zixibacteria bacterium]
MCCNRNRLGVMSVILAALVLLVGRPASADTPDSMFATATPVKGDIPGLMKWANSRPSDSAHVTILSPKEGERFKAGESLYVAVSVTGVSLGQQTMHAEGCGLANSGKGQHVHVIVDNQPYLANYADGSPFPLGVLPEGVHTIRVFASRSWHESIKSLGSFKTVTFYVGDAKAPSPIQPGKPLLTYSRPKDAYAGADAKSILVDFYLNNADLSSDGYKVRLTVDGRSANLTEWVPYLVTGLQPGDHHFKLELVNKSNQVVAGPYNTTERTITVK